MAKKPSYEELEQKVKKLERLRSETAQMDGAEKEGDTVARLLQFAPYAVYLADLSGNIVSVNKRGAEDLGKSVDTIIGTPLRNHFAPDISEKRKLKGMEVIRSGKPLGFEDQIGDSWYYNTIFPILNNRGEVERLAIYGVNITEFKRTMAALRESEERYRRFIDNAPIAMYTLNTNGEFTYGNKKLLEITGYKTEDWLNKSFRPVVHPEDLDNLVQRVADRLAGVGNVDPYEVRIFHSSGKILWVRLTAQPIYDSDEKDGKKIIGIQTFLENITDRKLAEDALRESEEKYRAVLENIEDGYYEVDVSGDFTFFNDSMCRILRYPRDELMGMNNREYMDQKNAKKIYQAFNKVFRTGVSTKALDWELIRKDGSECFVETVVSLVKDADGQPVGFRGIARDVTERKRAERERNRLEAQLYQAERIESLGTLAGGIAHDFNNLLMGIQGRTSLLLMAPDISSSHIEHLKGIEDYIQSAAGLTKQLLGFARGGKYEVKPTDLNELIKNQNRMFGRTRKEIQIEEKLDGNIWTADVDQGQIGQLLLNIYVNAWQAMPAGGNLCTRTENVILDENFKKPYQVTPGKYIKISISDTGTGIDERIQRKIFDPFFTTKRMGRGTGLGLASAYGIVKNHSGYIDFYSKKGHGTTFEIYLPASEKAVVEDEKPAEQVLKGSETILFVDDEYIVIDVGQQILKKLGYTVFLARSGKEAIETYRKNRDKIDMVVLDMIMPEMSGAAAYEKLKKINPGIKVLLSSGYSVDGQANDILARGCNGFIQKPFNMANLSAKIREILDRK